MYSSQRQVVRTTHILTKISEVKQKLLYIGWNAEAVREVGSTDSAKTMSIKVKNLNKVFEERSFT